MLLQQLCNETIKSFGENGSIVHDQNAVNDLGMAGSFMFTFPQLCNFQLTYTHLFSAVLGQQALLKFGFNSTHAFLRDISKTTIAFLDGRSDLASRGRTFQPLHERFKAVGGDSVSSFVCECIFLSQSFMPCIVDKTEVMSLKKEVIGILLQIADLRTNFRLAQLLNIFKQKATTSGRKLFGSARLTPFTEWLSGENSNHIQAARDYLVQATEDAIDAMYNDFESMFRGGTGEASKV
jgi:hypothetical protein